MALASAYAISGLSQNELCSSIYGMQFQVDPVQVLPLSECIPPDFFFNRWVWLDFSSEALLLFPLEARIPDVKRAEAKVARDQVQKTVLPDTTPLAGKMLRFDLLPRFSTYLASLSVRGALRTTSSLKALEGKPQRLQGR